MKARVTIHRVLLSTGILTTILLILTAPRAQADVLRVTTLQGPMGYTASRDTSSMAGFSAELFSLYAQQRGMQQCVTRRKNYHELVQDLQSGTAQVVAFPLQASIERHMQLDMTHPLLLSRQVLVQRRPTCAADSALFVHSPLELAEKTVYIPLGAQTKSRVAHLCSEIGDTIYVRETAHSITQLMGQVARGQIDYTLCEENMARHASQQYPELDTSIALSLTQSYAWAVSPRDASLLHSLNQWIDSLKHTAAYQDICKRYLYE